MIKLLLILIVSGITFSEACSCIQRTKQQQYCDSQFAGIIDVLTDGSDCQYKTCYGISVVQQIRGTATSYPFLILQTGTSSASCGVSLVSGHTYFMAGSVIDDFILGLYICQLYEDWTGLSKSDIDTKINKYKSINCGVDTPVE